MNSLHIKKGDTVIVLSGKDKGKKGKVQVAMPKDGKVIVEGVNMATKHTKPKKQGESGGIIKQETPIRACKIMNVCPKCNKPTRPAYKTAADGAKLRVCKHCGETI